MRVSGDWIETPATRAVCAMLANGGYRALFVGGCVRNALIGAPVGDIDIATDAHPERVIALAKAAGFKAVPTGIEHGTITVVSDGLPHEITTFRRDVETFGRHAVVAFSDSVFDDAQRRDFTMNALYAEADGTVIDPLGGLADLNARRVRFIGDAEQRIREDYLRILRFFRFHAWYGDPEGGLDPEALHAIADNLDGLASLSKERVGHEMRKLLMAPDPAPSVAAMRPTGVLAAILPAASDRGLAPLVHLEHQFGLAEDALRRLAVLGGATVAEGLRLSKAETRQLTTLSEETGSLRDAGELGYRYGADRAIDVLLLRAALLETPMNTDDPRKAHDGASQVFPVKAADLMPKLSGPSLGARLAKLETLWVASGFTLTRDDLLDQPT